MHRTAWRFAALAALALALAAGPALAGERGFQGHAWGAEVGTFTNFVKLKQIGSVGYYVNLSESYEIKGFPKPVVFYGFVGGKLYAAYVRLDSIEAYEAVKKDLTARYGKAKVKQEQGRVENRWLDGKVRIKLKADMGNRSMKLAYYYEPLAPKESLLGDELDAASFSDLVKEWERQSLKK